MMEILSLLCILTLACSTSALPAIRNTALPAGPRPILKDAWLQRCRKEYKDNDVKLKECIDKANKWYEDHGWKSIPGAIDIESDRVDNEEKHLDRTALSHLISPIRRESWARKSPTETLSANIIPIIDEKNQATAAYCWRNQEDSQCTEWVKKWRAWANTKNPVDVAFKRHLSDEKFPLHDKFLAKRASTYSDISSADTLSSYRVQQICQQYPNKPACFKHQDRKQRETSEAKQSSGEVKRDEPATPIEEETDTDEDVGSMWGIVDSVLEAMTESIKTKRKEKYHKTWEVVMNLTDALQLNPKESPQIMNLRVGHGFLRTIANDDLPVLVKRKEHAAHVQPKFRLPKSERRAVNDVLLRNLNKNVSCGDVVDDSECEEYLKADLHSVDPEPTAEYCWRHQKDSLCQEWAEKFRKGVGAKKENPTPEPDNGQPDKPEATDP
jgi:hypothetical protein